MKTVFCQLSCKDKPKPGEEVRLTMTTPRGGRTDACYVVATGDDLAKIADGLAADANKIFLPECFTAKARGTQIIVTCSDAANDAIFRQGHAGSVTITVEE